MNPLANAPSHSSYRKAFAYSCKINCKKIIDWQQIIIRQILWTTFFSVLKNIEGTPEIIKSNYIAYSIQLLLITFYLSLPNKMSLKSQPAFLLQLYIANIKPQQIAINHLLYSFSLFIANLLPFMSIMVFLDNSDKPLTYYSNCIFLSLANLSVFELIGLWLSTKIKSTRIAEFTAGSLYHLMVITSLIIITIYSDYFMSFAIVATISLCVALGMTYGAKKMLWKKTINHF